MRLFSSLVLKSLSPFFFTPFFTSKQRSLFKVFFTLFFFSISFLFFSCEACLKRALNLS